jgi:hypothetical protein
LGFKSGQDLFKVYYAEIPIESTVLWMDSLRTTNLSNETSRLLAGRYVDPVFGPTQAQTLTQFRPIAPLATTILPSAVFDSIVFQMRFDFYTYGSTGVTTQTFNVYEISEELNLDDDYFFNSDIDLAPASIGTRSAVINYDFFKKEYEDTDVDSVITLKVKLTNSFGQRLFDAIDPEDVNYTDFDLFKIAFKGLAIVPQQSDKIVGLNPNELNSSLILYYHDGTDLKTVSYVFSQGISFSKIMADRSSTDLSGLNQYYTDFDPGLKRYIQGGSSVVTKLDFTKFYEYMDTISNIMINSAELDVSGVESSTTLKEPKSLSVSTLLSNNRYKTFSSTQDTTDFLSFNGTLTVGDQADQAKFFVANGPGEISLLNYSAEDKAYRGFQTLFVQQLFKLKSTRYPFWALRPFNPQPGKSVDRLVFPKDKIKLKIYYTRADIDNQ